MQLQQTFTGSDFLAHGVEQAIDGQNEEIAVQTVELVAAVAVGTVDPEPAGFCVAVGILADELAPGELAQVREQVAQRAGGLPADERRTQQSWRGYGARHFRSCSRRLNQHSRSVAANLKVLTNFLIHGPQRLSLRRPPVLTSRQLPTLSCSEKATSSGWPYKKKGIDTC